MELYSKIGNFALEMSLSLTSDERKKWAELIYHERERKFSQNGERVRERERGFSGWARSQPILNV